MLTRVATDFERPADSLYGIDLGGLRVDALPVDSDHDAWTTHFLAVWPPGTPAYRNYYDRIAHGTWLTPDQSERGAVSSRA